MRHAAIALLVAAAALPLPAAAQQPTGADSLRRGAYVRVVRGLPGAVRVEQEGTVDRLSGDTITLRVTTDRFENIVLAGDQSLQIRTGRQRRTWQGLGIGAAAGAIAGLLIVGGTYEPCSDCMYDPGAGATAAGGAVLFGLLGAGIGAMIGASSGPETWVPAQSSSGMRLGLAPVSTGGPARLWLTLSF